MMPSRDAAGASGRRTPVAVLGATGYVGVELIRLLVRHPAVELVFLSSEQHRGRQASEVYPFLAGIADQPLAAPEDWRSSAAEVVFCALPHGASAPFVRDVLADGRRVLDMSADFRLRDPDVYARWYATHPAPELLEEAVYGLPELHREALAGARLVAVPGCYPTGAMLGLAPLARAGLIDQPVMIDSKSGTTGAGRSAKVEQLFAEVNENFRPYGVGAHRHGPEIEQELRRAGARAGCLFVPHLLPVSRGIVSTMYVALADGAGLGALYQRSYGAEPFVVLRGAQPPELREVRGTNRCAIGWHWDAATGRAVVMTAIDNLGKGAAGQGVQCLNVLLGLPETTGLLAPALVP
jgi:N-acetyl-gamma-glutamyl-phosphate reductase